MASQHQPAPAPVLTGLREDDPTIEALRGWAALMVMATHYIQLLTSQTGLWGFASTGVDLFFVLSGYVFAPYLFGKPLSLAPHLIRRFFRLYPLYVCALLLYAGLHLPANSAWDHFGIHLVMGHTLASPEIAYYYNAAFWSLPPEVEYYLMLPLLAWTAIRFHSVRYRFAALLLLAAAIHLALVAAGTPNEGITARAIATIHLPGVLIEFMWGSMAYALVQRAVGAGARLLRLVSGSLVLAGMIFLYASYVAPVKGLASTPPPWVGGNMGVGAALGYALLISALLSAKAHQATNGKRWFTPWFLFMGQLSYGVYLFHNAAPLLLRRLSPELGGMTLVMLCIALTLLLAAAAHYSIERPLRNYGRKLSQAFRK
ncbi:MAG: acyltransferase [Comamonadaceae bacterium]